MTLLIDTHGHLDLPELAPEIPDIIERAQAHGIGSILNVGISVESSERSIALAKEYACVYASVGIHPHEAHAVHDPESLRRIRTLLAQPKVVALGEVGLDYYRNQASKEDQRALFTAFLMLHQETKLPLILHARDSFADVFRLIDEARTHGDVRGVFHCFTGNQEELKAALDRGLYISFTGMVTFPKNTGFKELIAFVPDDRLLLETDCPYLAPQKYRGKRNEPAYMIETAEYIAEVRRVRREDIARITARNVHDLFGFPEIDDRPKRVYKIRDSVYINTSIGCTNECTFCVKFYEDVVKGHNLRITQDPTVEEVLADIAQYQGDFKEVVFCGFGEPLLRLDFILRVARELKKQQIRIRIDTNGHGNLIHKRTIVSDLAGLVDEICISINAPDRDTYMKLCRPHFTGDVYQAVLDFTRECTKVIPVVTVTFLDLPGIDVAVMERIARDLGVQYRLRHYDVVG